VHVVVLPLALELPSVLPGHHSLPLFLAFLEFPHKGIAIAVKKLAVAALLVELVVALEGSAVLPGLLSGAVALVVLPVALVLAAAN
jgi:hypothetical protein